MFYQKKNAGLLK